MSDKTFVFAADRHGREDEAEGDIYIGAGDEIYAVDNQENANGIEEHETGFYGNADSRSEVAEYAAGELEERFAQLSEDYEEAYLALGNHEDQLLNKDLVKQVAGNYENVHIKEDDLAEIEGRNFYFGESFQANSDQEQLYDDEVAAEDAGYDEDELEEVGEVLGKDSSEVNCDDINALLDGDVEQESSSKIREVLESAPLLGEYVFEPLYRLKDKYFEPPTETVEIQGLEKTEQHEEIDEVKQEYDEMISEKVERIADAEGEVTYVAHGQPQTDEKPFASIQTREILERSENLGAAYVGHFHGAFDGQKEKEIAGTKVINPMEGYTIDESGGALQNYETHQFEGDPVADAEPVELQQGNAVEDLSEEQRQRVNEIFQEAQQEASSEQELNQILQERMQEEGIQI